MSDETGISSTSAPENMIALNQQVSEALYARHSELVAHIVARGFGRPLEPEQPSKKAVGAKLLEDTGFHLAYLTQAIASGSSGLFANYIGWAKVMLAKRGVPAAYLGRLLTTMTESLQQELPPEFSPLACDYLNDSLRRLPKMPDEVPSLILEVPPHGPLAAKYLQLLLRGERHVASKLILDAVRQGTPVRDIYLNVFQRTQYEIGRLWQVNRINVAQEHYCTAATQVIMSQLYPYIFDGKKGHRTLVAACVSGDLHEIGARMVCDFFEMDGWNTYYLGANVPTPSVVQTLIKQRANVLAISATITYHVRAVEALIATVRRAPECGRVKILVGGYPFNITPDLWREIGADGSAADAQAAVLLANRLDRQSLVA